MVGVVAVEVAAEGRAEGERVDSVEAREAKLAVVVAGVDAVAVRGDDGFDRLSPLGPGDGGGDEVMLMRDVKVLFVRYEGGVGEEEAGGKGARLARRA